MSRRSISMLLFLSVLIVLVWVATPVFLIMPFKSQAPWMLAVSHFLKAWAPWVTAIALAAAAGLVFKLWQLDAGSWQRTAAIAAFVPLAGATWFARQNHFEWMFAPLSDPAYVRGAAADFVKPADMVLGVVVNDDAAAWPVNQLSYHHVVNTEIGGVPIAATY
jgi:uncharacterized membrane protein